MPKKRIRAYGIYWNPGENKGGVDLDIGGGSNADVSIELESAADVIAIAAILQKTPVYLSKNGTISTGRVET